MKTTGLFLILLAGVLTSGCDRAAENPPASTSFEPYQIVGTIVAVGDSLTAGYKVKEEEAYPALLEKRLHAAGYPWRVVNAGISGETSSGALSRIDWALKLEPDIVILETGANDGLRGIDPQLTKRNIEEIVRILEENGVTVVLAGMKMVPSLGREFLRDFAAIYPQIAQERDLIFMPFFLAGVAGKRSLNQEDGIHPTAEGYQIITDNLYPYAVEAIKRNGQG